MALAETAKLVVQLNLDDKLTPAIGKVKGGLNNLGNTAKTVGKGIAIGLGTVAVGGALALTHGIAKGLDSLRLLEVATAQTNAVIKSTKGAAGLSAQAIVDLSEKYESLNATMDNKVIQSAENVLLTFTKVTKKAFEPALEAALNINQAMGGGPEGLQKTVVQLGKALNDPVKGITALTRIGVTFSVEQQKQIKALVAQNDLYGAQQIILKELGTEFGGSFAAAGNTAAGAQAKLADSIEDVQVALATDMLPVVQNVTKKLSDYLGKPSTLKFFQELGHTISGLFTDENLDTAAGAIKTAATAVSGAISLFNKLPPEIKALAIGAFALNKVTGGAVTGVAGALGKALGAGLNKIFAANVVVVGKNVTGGGGIPGVGGKGGGIAGKGGGILGAAAKGGLYIGGVAAIAYAVSQIYKGPKAMNAFTPTVGAAFAPPKVTPAAFSGIDWGAIAAGMGPGIFGKVGDAIRGPLDQLARKINAEKFQDKLDRNLDQLRKLQAQLHRAKESGDERRIGNLRSRIDRTNSRVDAAKQSITSATVAARDAARTAGISTSGATRSGSSSIVAAINGIQAPIVNLFVTASNVQKETTYANRGGPPNGSAGGGRGGGGAKKP